MDDDTHVTVRCLHQGEEVLVTALVTSPYLNKLWSTDIGLSGDQLTCRLPSEWLVRLSHYPPPRSPFAASFHSVPLPASELPLVAQRLQHLPWFSIPHVSPDVYRQTVHAAAEQHLIAHRARVEQLQRHLEQQAEVHQLEVEAAKQAAAADAERQAMADIAEQLAQFEQHMVERVTRHVDELMIQELERVEREVEQRVRAWRAGVEQPLHS